MSNTLVPPSYDGENSLPPAYGYLDTTTPLVLSTSYSYLNAALPQFLTVNGKNVRPLVHPSDLQAHLVLLGAFRRLREEVLTRKGATDYAYDPNDRWTVFLFKAVHRFQCWAERVVVDPDQTQRGVLRAQDCPPLDVVLVWLVYMLVSHHSLFLNQLLTNSQFQNPRTYREDCLRLHKGLDKLGFVPKPLTTCLLPHSPL
jgi:hypothetical protein